MTRIRVFTGLMVLPLLVGCNLNLTAQQQAAIVTGTGCLATTAMAVHAAVVNAPAGSNDTQKGELAANAALATLTGTQPCQQAISAGLAAASQPATATPAAAPPAAPPAAPVSSSTGS